LRVKVLTLEWHSYGLDSVPHVAKELVHCGDALVAQALGLDGLVIGGGMIYDDGRR
jgi:hypothetical protein